ncbi:hypothetical protein VitviT2T_002392 [Vitis vinifera]|uniref:Late embryogenesis abundant protein 6 n=2 Tax=Vitis vinifera TaxID=29760 RepID=A0ABY9BIX7_VITVI|nr:late embryogenesis abundant protein 18 [Vitis vinifera]WJZ82654.1 hypothetical protein VitviT2T_002392 [Vitis vinifera]|eukprot:XP_002281237.1 PREDICTED: late embryogenesis abundant protein 18 [Vitis vinifera]
MMQSYKEKISNMASVAKEHITICKARAQEKAEKAMARTKEEKEIAKERRKAKEAQAKMQLHAEKAEHAARKLNAKHSHLHSTHTHQGYNQPAAGATAPMYPQPQPVVGATTAPTYPPSTHPPPEAKYF